MRSLLLAVLVLFTAQAGWTAAVPTDLVKSFTLSNGMRFLVVEKPEVPTITCVIYFDVGAGDEPAGKTGMAHLLEHLMFKGSARFGTSDWDKEKPLFEQVNAETRRWIEVMDASLRARPPGVFRDDQKLVETDELKAVQAQIKKLLAEERKYIIKNEFWGTYNRHGGEQQNAFTSEDATGYFVVLPANKLELWATLESERIARPVYREFHSERDVVMEEKRLGEESNPEGRLYDTLAALAFPTHPYGRPVVGYWDDLRHMSHEDVAAFHQAYYKPNNAVAAVVGGTTVEQVKALAQRFFEPIPRGETVRRLWTEEPPLDGRREARVVFDAQPQAVWAYRVPGMDHPDLPALHVTALILGSGASSRLHRRLVLEQKLAISVGTWCEPRRAPELFYVSCVPFKGHTVDEVERAIREEVERLAKNGPEDKELRKVKKQLNSREIYRLESPMGLGLWLAQKELLLGDWKKGYRYLDRTDAVTAADVQRVVARYLVEDNEIKVSLKKKTEKKEAGK